MAHGTYASQPLDDLAHHMLFFSFIILTMPMSIFEFDSGLQIQSEIIRGNAMEALLHSPNVEILWEDMVDCDTVMAAQAFRKFGFSSSPHVSKLQLNSVPGAKMSDQCPCRKHPSFVDLCVSHAASTDSVSPHALTQLSLHGAAGMRALTRDWVGMNHLITQGCISALLHLVVTGLSRARSLALEAVLNLMDSADARATLHRDGGIPVLERLTREKMGLRMSPNFVSVSLPVFDLLPVNHAHVKSGRLTISRLEVAAAKHIGLEALRLTPKHSRGRLQ